MASEIAWEDQNVLVTGGASLIGSHLVEALVRRGATVRVAEDFSSGARRHLPTEGVEILEGDLKNTAFAERAVGDTNTVFHLAADHGGRGYVDLNQWACATNFQLDGTVIGAAVDAGVGKFVFASSGCVYPNHLQGDTEELLYLTEERAGPPYDCDNLYGYAKMMGEQTLQAAAREGRMNSASVRYFTVYGPRGVENHAVIAMIARAFVRQDPFEVWGTGEQIRNWTYVDDIVSGTIAAAEHIDDGTAVNLGTMERVRVLDAAHMICDKLGHRPEFQTDPSKPTGPYNRVAENSLARKLMDWEPQVGFEEGVDRTIEWYIQTHDRQQVAASLERLLVERGLR